MIKSDRVNLSVKVKLGLKLVLGREDYKTRIKKIKTIKKVFLGLELALGRCR